VTVKSFTILQNISISNRTYYSSKNSEIYYSFHKKHITEMFLELQISTLEGSCDIKDWSNDFWK